MTVPSGAVVGGAQDEAGDQRGPARLVAGADAPAGVTVEVLVEGQQVVPVPAGLERHRAGVMGHGSWLSSDLSLVSGERGKRYVVEYADYPGRVRGRR